MNDKVGRLVGTLTWWSARRNCGVISVRTGNKLESYFLHLCRIVLCEVEQPSAGDIVHFEIDPRRPKRPEDFPCARNAEVHAPDAVAKGAIDFLAGHESKTGGEE